MLARDLMGVRVYRAPAKDKAVDKDGAPREPKRLGRVHFPVFIPDGTRVVGFMVKLPDVAGMIKQKDRFVALDALTVYEGTFAVTDVRGEPSTRPRRSASASTSTAVSSGREWTCSPSRAKNRLVRRCHIPSRKPERSTISCSRRARRHGAGRHSRCPCRISALPRGAMVVRPTKGCSSRGRRRQSRGGDRLITREGQEGCEGS